MCSMKVSKTSCFKTLIVRGCRGNPINFLPARFYRKSWTWDRETETLPYNKNNLKLNKLSYSIKPVWLQSLRPQHYLQSRFRSRRVAIQGWEKRKPKIKSLPLRSLYNTEFQNTRQILVFRVLSNKINN